MFYTVFNYILCALILIFVVLSKITVHNSVNIDNAYNHKQSKSLSYVRLMKEIEQIYKT